MRCGGFRAVGRVTQLIWLLPLCILTGCPWLRAQTGPEDPLNPSYAPKIDMVSQDYPANVWVTDGMIKVHQEVGGPGSIKWALISGAKNEWESFQIHVHAGDRSFRIDNVTVSDLVNARTSTRIRASRNIVVYREGYSSIAIPSDANGMTGDIPDVLIPTVDPYFGQTTNAFPVTIAPGRNQSVWIDVLIPEELASGYYIGTAVLQSDNKSYASLPILLTVWNFSLPSTASLRTAYGMTWDAACIQYYGSYNNCGAYSGSTASADQGVRLTDIDEAVMFLDHRIALDDVVYGPPTDNNWSTFDDLYGPLLNGAPAHTKTILPGASMNALRYQAAVVSSSVQQWVANTVKNGWLSSLFQYTCDEPPAGCAWQDINVSAGIVHGTKPSMRTLVTTNFAKANANGVLSGIDILVPIINDMEPHGGVNQRATYNAWLQSNPARQLWLYQSCESSGTCSNGTVGPRTATWPSHTIDASSVRNRIFEWMIYFYGATGELYYSVDYCWYKTCGYPSVTRDPWISIYAFGGNGDGTLIYPGTSSRIGVNVPVPLPSVRLKLVRDGIEDYEYLIALDHAGRGQTAREIMATFITNGFTFSDDPAQLQRARQMLGGELHRLALAAQQITPPSNLRATVY